MGREIKVKENKRLWKAEELFTDRVEPQEAFWKKYDELVAEPGKFDMIHYYGVGGIGKTALLKKIITDLITDRDNPNVILYSFELEKNRNKATFLYTLARQIEMRVKDADFYIFYYAYYKYLKKNELTDEEIDDRLRKANTGIVSSKVTDLLKGTITLGTDFLPVLGNTVGFIGDKVVDLIVKSIEEKRLGNETATVKYIEEIDDLSAGDESDIENSLDTYFTVCCSKTLENTDKPFVIMLDAYEFMNDVLLNDITKSIQDVWLSGTGTKYNPGLVEQLPNVLWVIAGREKLKWGEQTIPQEDTHLLGNLSFSDAKDFFLKIKKTNGDKMNEDLISDLYELTKGTPVFMDMCIDIFLSEDTQSISDYGMDGKELSIRYLKGMKYETRKTVEFLCCLPGVWTDEIVEYVYSHISSDEPYDIYVKTNIKRIKEHTFVEKSDDGYKIHSIFRNAIRSVTEAEELMKLTHMVCRYLLDEYDKGRTSKYLKTEIMQTLLSYFDECIEIYENNVNLVNRDVFDEIICRLDELAKLYEAAELWGKAAECRISLCNLLERCKGFITVAEDMFFDEYSKLASDHFAMYFRTSDIENMNVGEKYALLCFELAKQKVEKDKKRVFEYVYHLWNLSGARNVEMYAFMESLIPEIKDQADEDIKEMIAEIEQRTEWESFMESSEEARRADENRAQMKREEKEVQDALEQFLRNYDPEKEYREDEIMEINRMINHLEGLYFMGDAYDLMEKLYDIMKRQAGGKDTLETIKIHMQMVENRSEDYVGDLETAGKLLNQTYDAASADPEIKKTAVYGEILKKLSWLGEMQDNADVALRYYKELKAFQENSGQIVMDFSELDRKIGKLSLI